MQTKVFLATALLAGSAIAHGGSALDELRLQRDFMATQHRRDLPHCAESLKDRGVEARNIARRQATVHRARRKRDLDTYLNTDHNKTAHGHYSYTPETDPTVLFASNKSCLLTPDLTQGPYFISGEQIRPDVREDQQGIDTILEYQLIGIDTCAPIPNVYMELWHCNSTGVYSGVVAEGNGNGWQDQGNINKTFLRGVQPTDDDGVVQFETIFPGHYSGRATHIHVLVHTNVTPDPTNNTLVGSAAADTDVAARHVGQTYWDQDLIDMVDTVYPYLTNTQELVENSEDVIISDAAANDTDPFFQYAYLGPDLSDGIFGWIAFGVNMSEHVAVTPAAHLTANGGRNTTDFDQDDYIGAPTRIATVY